MAVSGIIFQMITLFIMMFAGYASARAGLITPDFRRGLSSLVLSTAFPCCIVASVLQSGGAPGDMVSALGVLTSCCSCSPIWRLWASRLFRLSTA